MIGLKRNHSHEPLNVGDCLSDRYAIVERITAGGHSIVYRGEDQRLSRPVCIKVFHRLNAKDSVYQTAHDHFVQEAFALSKLTHPNTLRIYDFGYLAGDGDEPGPPFQVSEFMNHGTLTSLIQRGGPVTRRDAIPIVTALGGALSEAHECGIVHRDIKPPNILFGMVGRTMVAKLADFGIAKSLAEAAEALVNQAEDTAVVAGRPLLMYSLRWAAPEQLMGRPVSAAADVYSLALTLAFMLTGNVVFVARDKMDPLEQRKRSDGFIESAFAGHDAPAEAVELLKAACAFNPRERPTDVEELAAALAKALEAPAGRAPTQPQLSSVGEGAPHRKPRRAPTPLPPRRIHVSPEGEIVSDRHSYFVQAHGGQADLSCAGGAARLRVSFVPSAAGFCLHVKGLNCFVARGQGRPTSAVQFDHDGRCEVVAPNQQQIASIAVSLGAPAAGHRVFLIGSESVALSVDECPQVATLDFGAGGECVFVYRAGAGAAQARWSAWRKTTS